MKILKQQQLNIVVQYSTAEPLFPRVMFDDFLYWTAEGIFMYQRDRKLFEFRNLNISATDTHTHTQSLYLYTKHKAVDVGQ